MECVGGTEEVVSNGRRLDRVRGADEVSLGLVCDVDVS